MGKYKVQIEASIVKTYEVEADDEDSAIEQAHQLFDPGNDGVPDDKYDEQLVEVNLVNTFDDQ